MRSTMNDGFSHLSRSVLTKRISELVVVRSQFTKFVAVGCINAAFGYSIFTIAYFVSHNNTIAVIFNWFLGIVFNFFSTGSLVFSSRNYNQIIPFVASYLVSMCLNLILINVLVSLKVSALLAQALCLPVIVVVSYLIMSRLVFARRP